MSNCSSLLLGLTDIDVDLVGIGADGGGDGRPRSWRSSGEESTFEGLDGAWS